MRVRILGCRLLAVARGPATIPSRHRAVGVPQASDRRQLPSTCPMSNRSRPHTRRMLVGLAVLGLSASAVAGATQAQTTSLRPLADEAGVVLGAAVDSAGLDDAAYRALLIDHVNMLSTRDQLSMSTVQPEQGVFDFGRADAIVDFAVRAVDDRARPRADRPRRSRVGSHRRLDRRVPVPGPHRPHHRRGAPLPRRVSRGGHPVGRGGRRRAARRVAATDHLAAGDRRRPPPHRVRGGTSGRSGCAALLRRLLRRFRRHPGRRFLRRGPRARRQRRTQQLR